MDRVALASYLLSLRFDGSKPKPGYRPVKKQVKDKRTNKVFTRTYHEKIVDTPASAQPKISSPGINPINGKRIGPMYSLLPPGKEPKQTRKVYKLMEVQVSRPGIIFPLFAKPEGEKQGFAGGLWYKAEVQRPKMGKKELALRPGLHGVGLPVFDQGKAMLKSGPQRVWVEVEMPSITSHTQSESDNSDLLPNGNRSGVTKRLIDPHESYDYKTSGSSSMDAGSWPVAGSMKIVRVLSDKEVESVLRKNNLSHQVENSMTGVDEARAEKMNADIKIVSESLKENHP